MAKHIIKTNDTQGRNLTVRIHTADDGTKTVAFIGETGDIYWAPNEEHMKEFLSVLSGETTE